MAMTIFFALSGMGLAFLLYVLANFWREGRRTSQKAQTCEYEFGQRGDGVEVVVVSTPLSPNAWYAPAVIPFRSRSVEIDEPATSEPASRGTSPARVKRASTR